jgi:hypothetical protein
MVNTTTAFKNAISASTRKIKARVELFEGSTLVNTFTQDDAIMSIDIERVGEDSKFFGFGVTHRFHINLRDVTRALNISTNHNFKISLGVVIDNTISYVSFPQAYVTEVNRDENTNALSITAYDCLNKSKTFTVDSLGLQAPYTIKNVIEAAGGVLGASSVVVDTSITAFNLSYETGANFEGNETLQEVLTAAAEATQTIYYMNSNNALVFKQLDKDGAAIKSITKNDYITLDSSTNRRLQTIASVTELGDNVSASTTQLGTTQYVRNNPFWDLREDIADLIENALATMGNITINQFNCSWRGDFSLEVGDKIELTTKDNQTVISYLLNDTIKYDGGLSEASEWEYKETEAVTSNPTTLGEALKYTYAQVDKANKQIDIVASETSANSEAISALQINTDSISASVKKVEETTQEALEGVNTDISNLTTRVEATMTAEDVNIAIKSELENGVSKVETTTGFKFDEGGLTISKTGSEMTTNIDEDGMTISRDNEEVLVADHEGVKAYNLHANTYLIIGGTSRFEDYDKDGETRTGCFWIGGAD